MILAALAAEHGSAQNVPFDRLYGNADSSNYYLGHYPVAGSDGLDIHWYGGVRIGTSAGTAIQVYNTSVGIGTDGPKAKLDITFPGEPKNILFMDSPNGVNTAHAMISRMRFSWYSDTADFGMVRSDSTPIEGFAVNFNDQEKVRFSSNGNVGIGEKNPQYKLVVANGGDIALKADGTDSGDVVFLQGTGVQNGRIWSNDSGGLYMSGRDNVPRFTLSDSGNASISGKFEAKELKVTTTPTADFVFERDYQLPDLWGTEKYIGENHHLPEVPSAVEMAREGVNIGAFQIKLLQKIEELTLYIINQQKQLERQQGDIQKLKQNRDCRP